MDGLIKNLPFFFTILTHPTGIEKGMKEESKAVEAPITESISGSFSWSAERTREII
jgi:hypothetical protein